MRPHRNPEKKAAEMTRMKPRVLKETSPATIIITPAVMVAIMATRRQEGVSRRKRKAKIRTNAREEDLHIAGEVSWGPSIGGVGKGRTIECEGYEF